MPTTILHNELYSDALKRRFAEESLNCIRAEWIDERIEVLMKDPVGLLCEMDDCNQMVLAALKAVTLLNHQAAQAELNDQLYAYARTIAKRDWDKERGYIVDLGWDH